MSTTVFPVLKSSNWKMTRTSRWATQVQTASSGDRKRSPLQTHTLWKWTLKNGVLQSAPTIGDLQAIEGLYIAMYGRQDFFLWQDPEPASIEDPTHQVNILGVLYWPVAFMADTVDFDRFAHQLWTCGTLEFEQVGMSALALARIQEAHGAMAAVALNVTWSWDTGGGGPETVIQHGSDIPAIFGQSGSWATRTDVLTIPIPLGGSLNGWSFSIHFQTANNGTVSPPWLLSVYEVTATAAYQDGFVDTLRPFSVVAFQGQDASYGTVLHPERAIDNNLATAATMAGSQVFPTRSNGELLFTF